jgi:hypothetical protein
LEQVGTDGRMDERMKEGSKFGKERFHCRKRVGKRIAVFLSVIFCLYRHKERRPFELPGIKQKT